MEERAARNAFYKDILYSVFVQLCYLILLLLSSWVIQRKHFSPGLETISVLHLLSYPERCKNDLLQEGKTSEIADTFFLPKHNLSIYQTAQNEC